MAYVRIRPRRSTLEEWNYHNPILAEGEMGVEVPNSGVGTGVVKVKFGDGVTAWKDLPYGINLDVLEDKLDKLERNNSILSSEVDVVETSEIVPDENIILEPDPVPENPGTGGESGGSGSGGSSESGSGESGGSNPGESGPGGSTEEPQPTIVYEKIETGTVDSVSIVKLTNSATFAAITEDSTPFYRPSGDSYVIAEGVTSDTFADLVTAGLYVKIAYYARFYPDVTSIYVKQSDDTYTEVAIEQDLGDTIYTTSGELYFKVVQ